MIDGLCIVTYHPILRALMATTATHTFFGNFIGTIYWLFLMGDRRCEHWCFVSDAAHELHTPLTVLRTNLDLMLDEQDVANRAAFVADAKVMVQRLKC